jgi:hypothetical protein
MLMGPVFRAELLRTGRRGRYYVLRLVYGMILLTLFWSGYQAKFAGSRTASIAAVAQFAETTFLTFAIVQLVTVLVIVPPLFGGTIADEKQRKTTARDRAKMSAFHGNAARGRPRVMAVSFWIAPSSLPFCGSAPPVGTSARGRSETAVDHQR